MCFSHLVNPEGFNPNRSALEFWSEPHNSILFENTLPPKGTHGYNFLYPLLWLSRRAAARTHDLQVQLLDTSKDSIILSQRKYLTLHKYSTFVQKYLWPSRQNKLQPKFKETQAYSGTPLFGRPPRRFLVDTDGIFYQYNLPSRLSQEHQEESVASRTSPIRVHILRTVG